MRSPASRQNLPQRVTYYLGYRQGNGTDYELGVGSYSLIF